MRHPCVCVCVPPCALLLLVVVVVVQIQLPEHPEAGQAPGTGNYVITQNLTAFTSLQVCVNTVVALAGYKQQRRGRVHISNVCSLLCEGGKQKGWAA